MQVGILGTITADGHLLTISSLNELDAVILYSADVSDSGASSKGWVCPSRRESLGSSNTVLVACCDASVQAEVLLLPEANITGLEAAACKALKKETRESLR
jgi:hypothetical protein